jgi:hypothetical protein
VERIESRQLVVQTAVCAVLLRFIDRPRQATQSGLAMKMEL